MSEHNERWCIECEKPFKRDAAEPVVINYENTPPKSWGLCQACRADLKLGRDVREAVEKHGQAWARRTLTGIPDSERVGEVCVP